MSSRPRWFSAFMRLWPLAEQADVVDRRLAAQGDFEIVAELELVRRAAKLSVAHRRVVAEDEERRPERPQLRERHAVDRRRHRVLADAEMQILAARAPGLEVSRALV